MTKVWKQNSVRESDRLHLSCINVLWMPLINVHTHTWLHTRATCALAVAPPPPHLSLSLSHSSIPSHFSSSHDPSHMLSHIGSSLGRPFSCSLPGCNNYSISRQCVPDCALGLSLQGANSRVGTAGERRGSGCHSSVQGGEKRKGRGHIFGTAPPSLSRGAGFRTNELRLGSLEATGALKYLCLL